VPDKVGTWAEQAVLSDIEDYFLIGYLGLIVVVLLAKGARTIHERRGGMVNLSYGNGRTVRVPKGLSVLEASLRNNVPHASVCGGRARCSTCRIRIIGDCSALPEPSQREALCSAGSGRLTPPFAWPASCGRQPIFRSSSFFLPHATSAGSHASREDRWRAARVARRARARVAQEARARRRGSRVSPRARCRRRPARLHVRRARSRRRGLRLLHRPARARQATRGGDRRLCPARRRGREAARPRRRRLQSSRT